MIRKNEMTGEWSLIAESRAYRPKISDSGECPFCRENEHMLDEILYSSADGRVRVVPNKYPAIETHEVVIDTDIHNEQFCHFSAEHMKEVLDALKHRYTTIAADKRIRYIQIFKNDGIKSGASIAHSHWQILAMPFVPETQHRIMDYAANNRCYICSHADGYTIFENGDMTAFCPSSPRYNYEIWIAPNCHINAFTGLTDDMALSFCRVLKESLSMLNGIYEDISYNICFYNTCINPTADMHFFTQIIPRRGSFAGFELATGSSVITVPPEKAAESLRNCLISH